MGVRRGEGEAGDEEDELEKRRKWTSERRGMAASDREGRTGKRKRPRGKLKRILESVRRKEKQGSATEREREDQTKERKERSSSTSLVPSFLRASTALHLPACSLSHKPTDLPSSPQATPPANLQHILSRTPPSTHFVQRSGLPSRWARKDRGSRPV